MTTQTQAEFVAIDTTFIQTNSLAHFMGGLGYTQKGNSFETDIPALKHHKVLSYRTAVSLHNSGVEGWKEDKTTNTFSPVVQTNRGLKELDMYISGYGLQKLMAHRLVQEVKLQLVKRKGLQVQSHMVKPQTVFLTGVLGLVN